MIFKKLFTTAVAVFFSASSFASGSLFEMFTTKVDSIEAVQQEGAYFVFDYDRQESYFVEKKLDHYGDLTHFKSRVPNPIQPELLMQGKTSGRDITFNLYLKGNFAPVDLKSAEYMIFRFQGYDFLAFKQDFFLKSINGDQAIKIGDSENIEATKTDFIEIDVNYHADRANVITDKGYTIEHHTMSKMLDSRIPLEISIDKEFYQFDRDLLREQSIFSLKKERPFKNDLSIQKAKSFVSVTNDGLTFHIAINETDSMPADWRDHYYNDYNMIRVFNSDMYLKHVVVKVNNRSKHWTFEETGKPSTHFYLMENQSKRYKFY